MRPTSLCIGLVPLLNEKTAHLVPTLGALWHAGSDPSTDALEDEWQPVLIGTGAATDGWH